MEAVAGQHGRVLVTVANFGGMDAPKHFPPGKDACFEYLDDSSLISSDLQTLAPRARGKFFKMCTHRTASAAGCDFLVWADASIELHPGIVDWLLRQLGSADCAFFPHQCRRSVKSELEYCVGRMRGGDEYLDARYCAEAMVSQVAAYEQEGFDASGEPLFECGLFIRRNCPHVNELFDAWYAEQERSLQDQLSLPYVLWKAGQAVRVAKLEGNVYGGPFHRFHAHQEKSVLQQGPQKSREHQDARTEEAYCLPREYVVREAVQHYDDRELEDQSQREVYEHARAIAATTTGCRRVCDVGCGSGFKLMKLFGDMETVGFETEPCLSSLRHMYPSRAWVESGKPEEGVPSLSPAAYKADLLICSDVVEHMRDPDVLMRYLADFRASTTVISTPDRAVLIPWGWPANGPPRNVCHVREWTAREFAEYASRFFTIVSEHHGVSQPECMWFVCSPKLLPATTTA